MLRFIKEKDAEMKVAAESALQAACDSSARQAHTQSYIQLYTPAVANVHITRRREVMITKAGSAHATPEKQIGTAAATGSTPSSIEKRLMPVMNLMAGILDRHEKENKEDQV